MSHFSNIKTQIRNVSCLKSALSDIGVAWKQGSENIKGYRGQTRNAEVVIEQENNYDIGFSWNGKEYELVADLQYWQQPWTVEGFLGRVSQRYAYHTVVNESANLYFLYKIG